MKKPTISVVIPVYKNKEMVLRHLKHNISFFKELEVIIVDDASGEHIDDEIRKIDSSIKCIVKLKNSGFAPTANMGLKAASGDFILLLNSDVKLFKPLPQNITQPFEDDNKLFAVTYLQKEKDESDVGKNRIYFQDGFPTHSKTQTFVKGINAWAEGGSSLFRTSMLKKLDYFDEIYAPFYWEDIDLSYRAYSRGWHVLFDPSYAVEHHHESTISKFYTSDKMKAIAFRNQLYFMWANISSRKFLKSHIYYSFRYYLSCVFKLNMPYIKGYIMAFLGFIPVYHSRKRNLSNKKVSDEEIFSKFEN